MKSVQDKIRLPWDAMRVFLEVARSGSANAAAAVLGLDHTTVGRHLRALEARLDAPLVERKRNRLLLTPRGNIVFEAAEQMEIISIGLVRQVNGLDDRLSGEIRIHTSEGLGTYWLIPAFHDFQDEHPGIQLNWLTTASPLMVPGEGTDLSVWWERPRNPNLIGRKLGEVRFSLFTVPSYAERNGLPNCIEDLADHSIVHFNGYQNNSCLAPWQEIVRRFPPAMRLESTLATETVLSSGKFLALLPDYAAKIRPDFVRAPLDCGVTLEIWLSYHEDQRRLTRLQLVAAELVAIARRGKGVWLR